MAETSTGKPYEVIDSASNWEVRLFKNEDPSELFWHRDKEDRIVKLIYGDVKVQKDNELPVAMNHNDSIIIRKETFHRVISEGPFILKIYKGD